MDTRVFLVEDLQNMRTLINDLFVSMGSGLRLVAAAGTEAEARLWLDDNAGAWDLAIVDLVLAEGSGMEVVRHMKQHWPELPVAVFSSYVTPGIRIHCLGVGADVVFDKTQTVEFIAWLDEQSRGAQLAP